MSSFSLIAKKELANTNQKTRSELRLKAGQLIFCFYALSKTCFAGELKLF
jgi:hypothetical protein